MTSLLRFVLLTTLLEKKLRTAGWKRRPGRERCDGTDLGPQRMKQGLGSQAEGEMVGWHYRLNGREFE